METTSLTWFRWEQASDSGSSEHVQFIYNSTWSDSVREKHMYANEAWNI